MSGNVWMFSDQIDDEDLEFMAHEFVTYTMACAYYGLGLKPLTRMAHEAGSIYKIGTNRQELDDVLAENIRPCSFRPFVNSNAFLWDTVFEYQAGVGGGGARIRPEIKAVYNREDTIGFALAHAPKDLDDSLGQFSSFCWYFPDNDLSRRGNGHKAQQYLAKEAFKSGLSAATISMVLAVGPEIYKAIDYLIKNGELEEKQFQRIGFAALKGGGEGFIRGTVSAAITIACKSGMLGEAFKSVCPCYRGPRARCRGRLYWHRRCQDDAALHGHRCTGSGPVAGRHECRYRLLLRVHLADEAQARGRHDVLLHLARCQAGRRSRHRHHRLAAGVQQL